jgi:magnesium-transporting ATPase (P-type)
LQITRQLRRNRKTTIHTVSFSDPSAMEELRESVNLYKSRKFDEDLEYVKNTLGGKSTSSLGIESILDRLKVDPKIGLNEKDADDLQRRDNQFGTNYKPPPETTPFYKFWLGALEDFMLKVLIGGASLSIVIDMSLADNHHRKTAWIEGCAIFVAVLVVSLVGSYNDWSKDV